VAVEESATRTYGEAADHLHRRHRIHLSKHRLEELTQTVGAYWLEDDRARFEVARATREPPVAQIPARRCCVFADGVMVHTDGDWHEARVGTVRSDGVDGREYKSSIARMCSVEELGEDLWRKACQMGYRVAELKAFLGDGSHWLWNLAQRHFSMAIQILDFWHVCEHISKCAKVFFGEGTEEASQWSWKVRQTIRAGRVEEVLSMVESLQARRCKAKREAKHELVTYLTNNRTRMDYPRYESLGLPIGSGEVEAQCKTLVQARCKQAGMRWHSNGVERLLRVRCAVKDGSFESHFGRWPTNLAAWQARRKKKQRDAA